MAERMVTDRRGGRWRVRGVPGNSPHYGTAPVARLEYREESTGEVRVCPAPRMPEEMSQVELEDRLNLLLQRERLTDLPSSGA